MKLAEKIIAELFTKGVKIWLDSKSNIRYKAPLGVLTEDLKNQIRENKNQIIIFLSKQTEVQQLPAVYANRENLFEPFPLTDIQQAYWIGRKEGLENGGIGIHAYIELNCENLKLDHFENIWNVLIERHDMLRAIVLPSGKQQILETIPKFKIKKFDIMELTLNKKKSFLKEKREELSHQVFDLEKWPQYEIYAIKLDEKMTSLHISFDGTLLDVRSSQVLFKELVDFYKNPQLKKSPLEISFRDYVLTTLEFQKKEGYKKASNYWKEKLKTLAPPPKLPLKNSRSLQKDERPHFERFQKQMDTMLWKALNEKGKNIGVTISSLLLTAYGEVLNKWSESSRFTINVPLFNRLAFHEQVNDMLGTFSSFTLVEMNFSNTSTFAERAKVVQQEMIKGIENSHFSGIRILRELFKEQGEITGGSMPIVYTCAPTIQGDSLPDVMSELGEVVSVLTQTPQVWIDNQIHYGEHEMHFNWDVLTDIFPDNMAEEMFTQYVEVLNKLASGDALWEENSIATIPSSHQEVYQNINDTSENYLKSDLYSLLLKQSESYPNKIALIFGNKKMSYQQLITYSNAIANKIISSNSEAPLIPIIMERGWEQIVSIYGVLAAGRAYVPIDAHQGKQRIDLILAKSEASTVLIQEKFSTDFEDYEKVEVIIVSEKELNNEPPTPIQVTIDGDNLAYVMYTSGSTGEPKGVMISHHSVINRMEDVKERFGLQATDYAIGLTPFYHDLSVFDIFCMLSINGGSLLLIEQEYDRDPSYWLSKMEEHNITLWNSVPTFMLMLLEYIKKRDLSLPNSLRWSIFSGDFIPVSLPGELKSYLPNLQVISAGGPTETTIWDICYPITPDFDKNQVSIPYGKPMRNARYYILNDCMESCPFWTVGEMYIGGVGLSKGYWKDSELTSQKFITHPTTGEPLYRSGDMGRLLPNGNIQITGRKDFQVKIRGHRIELEEIDHILQKHQNIHKAITLVTDDENKKLITYYTQNEIENSSVTLPKYADLGDVITDPITRVENKLKSRGTRELKNTNSITLTHNNQKELKTKFIQRQSYRKFVKNPISLESLSNLLASMGQLNIESSPFPKYLYPSAGGLYPIQIYLYIRGGVIEGINEGGYYYNPATNKLISFQNSEREGLSKIFNLPNFLESGFVLFLVAEHKAIDDMYGKLARDFCLLESGYIGQLLMMESPKQQIGLCPLGFIPFETFSKIFELTDSHELLHTFIGGKITSQQTLQLSEANTPKTNNEEKLYSQYLKKYLPSYMIPRSIVKVESYPLTRNGKVDRKKLLETTSKQLEKIKEYPETTFQKDIIEILSEILNQEVFMNDNFFELGGDSLLAIRFNSDLKNRFNIELSLRHLFEGKTIGSLIEIIESQLKESSTNQGQKLEGLKLIQDPENRFENFPLTDLQQAYWIGRSQQFKYGNTGIQAYIELECKNIDISHLTNCWNILLKRHDSLKTIIHASGEQQVLSNIPLYKPIERDFSNLSNIEKELEGLRQELSNQVFDIGSWPQFEVGVTKIDDRISHIHLVIDATLIDMRSFQILFAELNHLYNKKGNLPPLTLTFRDYVLSLKEMEKTKLYKESLNYWKNRIEKLPPAPSLPMNKQDNNSSNQFLNFNKVIEVDIWNLLLDKIKKSEFTESSFFLAVYAEVLSKWSENSHFTINVPLFNRWGIHPQTNDILGTFSSFTLVEYNKKKGNFRERVKNIQQQLFEGLEYSHVSGIRILREMNKRKGEIQEGIMPIVFTSEPKVNSAFLPELIKEMGEIITIETKTPQVWIDSQVHYGTQGVHINWDVLTDIFPDSMAEEMFTQYVEVLNKLASGDALWEENSIATIPSSHQEVYQNINDTSENYLKSDLYSLLLKQSESYPNKIALIFGNKKMSYQQLITYSNAIANKIISSNSEAPLIPIIMERGWEQIVSIYGVLAAGRAYVPIDAHQGKQRIDLILAKSEASTVLIQEKFSTDFEDYEKVEVIIVSEKELNNEPPTPIQVTIDGDNLAYVMYTSGSTGEPKGVMISHHSVINRMEDVKERFGLQATDYAIGLTPFYHDLSVFDIFCMLSINGGSLLLIEQEYDRDPSYWLSKMEEHNITLWNSVPTFMLMLLEYIKKRDLSLPNSLRWSIFSGDFIPVSLPGELKSYLPNLQVISAGGPTETTIWDICYPITPDFDKNQVSIPYGKPMRNARYYILNDCMESCPFWTVGEMYIGGVGLSKGYWKDSELTSQKFITHPTTGEPLYRSGDMGRLLPNGNIQITGRKDFQVKIRGHRIELEEIDHILQKHQNIHKAITLVDQTADRAILCSVIVPTIEVVDEENHISMYEEIHLFLKVRLPLYMLPTNFFFIDKMPLNTNGKINRTELKKIINKTPKKEKKGFVKPNTDNEKKIATIIKNIINEDLGIHDNFFERGGDSLLAMRLINTLKKEFFIDFPITIFFTEPTIERIVTYIELADWSNNNGAEINDNQEIIEL